MPASSTDAPTALARPGGGGDLVGVYRDRFVDIILKFGDDILDCVRIAKGVEVDDIRESLLGPLRRQKCKADDDGKEHKCKVDEEDVSAAVGLVSISKKRGRDESVVVHDAADPAHVAHAPRRRPTTRRGG